MYEELSIPWHCFVIRNCESLESADFLAFRIFLISYLHTEWFNIRIGGHGTSPAQGLLVPATTAAALLLHTKVPLQPLQPPPMRPSRPRGPFRPRPIATARFATRSLALHLICLKPVFPHLLIFGSICFIRPMPPAIFGRPTHPTSTATPDRSTSALWLIL